MWTPKALSYLTLSELECQRQGHSGFEGLYIVASLSWHARARLSRGL